MWRKQDVDKSSRTQTVLEKNALVLRGRMQFPHHNVNSGWVDELSDRELVFLIVQPDQTVRPYP